MDKVKGEREREIGINKVERENMRMLCEPDMKIVFASSEIEIHVKHCIPV